MRSTTTHVPDIATESPTVTREEPFEEAEELLLRSLDLNRQARDRVGERIVLDSLGGICDRKAWKIGWWRWVIAVTSSAMLRSSSAT